MSKAEDINTLFRRFGGDANSYQEIVASELADVAEQKWPILGQVRLHAHREAPAAHKGAVVVGGRLIGAFRPPPSFAVNQTRSPAAPTALSLAEAPVVLTPSAAEFPAAAGAPVADPSTVASAVSPPPVAETLVSRDVLRGGEHGVAAQSVVSTDSLTEAASGEPVIPDLQNLFHRLVPRKVETPVPPPVAPLKRLVKW